MHYDLLVHVDLNDEGRMAMALTNIANYKKALTTQEYSVVVLANAGAVNFMKNEGHPHIATIEGLMAQGVVFKACQNALNKFDLKAEQLIPGINIVPAGIVEIVDLQRAGFAYLKP